MTIALGILAGPAMVLAADTEVSTESAKTSGPKILWTQELVGTSGAFGITGSGPTSYLEAIYDEMRSVFLATASDGIDAIQDKFQERLDRFYSDHVIPFASYQDRPDFWLIIACERAGHRAMWTSALNVLRRVQSHAAVGIGEMQARALLNSLDLPVRGHTAQLLAAYLIYQVKQSIPGCGKDTDLICMENARVSGLHRRQVRELEEVFRKYTVIEGCLLHRTLGSSFDFADGDKINKSFAEMKDEIENILNPKAPRSRKHPKHGQQPPPP